MFKCLYCYLHQNLYVNHDVHLLLSQLTFQLNECLLSDENLQSDEKQFNKREMPDSS